MMKSLSNLFEKHLIIRRRFPLFNGIRLRSWLWLWFTAWPLITAAEDATKLVQQVEIAATIYEFRLENEKQLGIFYEYNRDSGAVQNSEVFLQGTENLKDLPSGALNFTGSFAKLAYGSIDFNIKTALQEGRAMVISNPRNLVADGQTSSLGSGEIVPLTKFQTLAGYQTTLTMEKRKTGIKLNVTPHILPGNNVLMDLEIESSEIIRLAMFDRGDRLRFELPVVSTRNVKTVVVVPSRKRLYIGGLYNNNASDLTRKIPILGDLPLLGFFLRGFNKKMTRSETVFQITPTIKAPGEGISAEGSIFRDLLETNSFENADNASPLQSMPAGIAPSATEVSNATSEISVPSAILNDKASKQSAITASRKNSSKAGYRPKRNRR